MMSYEGRMLDSCSVLETHPVPAQRGHLSKEGMGRRNPDMPSLKGKHHIAADNIPSMGTMRSPEHHRMTSASNILSKTFHAHTFHWHLRDGNGQRCPDDAGDGAYCHGKR